MLMPAVYAIKLFFQILLFNFQLYASMTKGGTDKRSNMDSNLIDYDSDINKMVKASHV